MGRYSQPLAVAFADTVQVSADMTALDIGCGPGALARVLVRRLGAAAVGACDPSPPFVQECVARYPGVDVRTGRAETTLTVTSTYTDFDELWRGFLAGIGPAGAYCTSLSGASRRAVRREFYSRLEHPQGAFSLSAVARCAYGR